MYQRIKIFLDIFIGLLTFILLLPLFIIISIILIIYFKGNPFYTQIRPGINERLFSIIKFKTMNNKKDSKGRLLPDSLRLTSFGNLIRKSSLDEIPQLLNVIRGQMSLIGPRPLLVDYLLLYNSVQRRRHEVRPGITGWAQVNGRNAISWNKKFELDVWYVDNISLGLDLKIVWLTFINVIKRSNINASPQFTMEKFTGNN